VKFSIPNIENTNFM